MKKIVFLSLFLVVYVNITLAQLPNYVPTNGLVAFWPFNGNANDASGNGNNGSLFGALLSSDRFSTNNKSIIQNTNGSHIRTQRIINNSANTFTISFWVKPAVADILKNQGTTGMEGTGLMAILHPTHGSSWGNSSSNAGVGINVGNNQIQIVEHAHMYIGSPLVYNGSITGWNNVTLVYDQHLPKLYLNGILVATGLISPILNIHPSSGFCTVYNQSGFGNSFNPNGNPIGNFKGEYDDIGIWNRALTNQEIISLYVGCPKISTQPTNQTASKGANGNFNVTHSGTNYTYQWQTNPIGCGWQNLLNANQYSGISTNALNINNLTVSNHNQPLRVIASKGSCIDTSNVVRIIISNIASDSLALISLKSDTTTKGNRIRQLEIDLANNRDTLYVGSNITTDTLIISIRTGLSTASSLVNTLRVYPNPAATVLNIELEKSGTYIAKISGITGQTIVTQTAGTIDISTLASGVYVLSIFDTNNKLVSTNKISVVR
jgi:hypothetical protein